MEKNTSLLIVGGAAIGVVVIYVISSYSGLLGTKTYVGVDTATETVSEVSVPTSMECTFADNELKATLTVQDSAENSAALDTGSALEAQTIHWSVAESLGKTVPATSVTDSDGVAVSQFEKTPNTETPVIIAAYEGGKIVIDGKATVEYEPSWCELSPSN